MSQNDLYLVKLKGAGLTDKEIGQRMNLSIEQVEMNWKRIQRELQSTSVQSSLALFNQYTVLCHQYLLVGESLKIISGALANEASSEELRRCCGATYEETVKNIKQNFIVLRPFTPIDPEESLKQSIKTAQGAN